MFKLFQLWHLERVYEIKVTNVSLQGEYVAPEKIENIYIHSKYVGQIFVYGNGLKVKRDIEREKKHVQTNWFE